MCEQWRRAAAAVVLSLFIVLTQTSCIYVAYLSDKAGQAVDSVTKTNSGVLVAAPGTRLDELRRNSTLDIGQGSGSLNKESKYRFFIQSKRFDWQLPNSQLLFKDCNSYAISTDQETGEAVVDMQVGTAQRYLTWAEVKAEIYDIERRLLADGWQPVVWKGESSSDRLHIRLQNPDFKQFDGNLAGAVYRKGDVAFTLFAKRARGENKPNIAEGENFLHCVITDFARDDEK